MSESWLVYLPVTDVRPDLVSPDIAFICVYAGTAANPERIVYGGYMPQTEDQITTWITTDDYILGV